MSPEPTPPKNDTGEIERDFAKSARPIPRAGRVQPQQRRRELATGGGGSLFLNRLARSARASRQESLAMLRLRARAATTAERRSDDGAAHDTSHDATVELATVPAGARPGSRFTHRAPWHGSQDETRRPCPRKAGGAPARHGPAGHRVYRRGSTPRSPRFGGLPPSACRPPARDAMPRYVSSWIGWTTDLQLSCFVRI